MYYIDSRQQEVNAFDYDWPTGELSARRTLISFVVQQGLPDGMTVDEGVAYGLLIGVNPA